LALHLALLLALNAARFEKRQAVCRGPSTHSRVFRYDSPADTRQPLRAAASEMRTTGSLLKK
jgi:hypothetical protein